MFDLSKPIAIGSDHAGYDYKVALVNWLTEKGYTVSDKGVDENRSVDYPDYVHPLAKDVATKKANLGILVCGSGNGVGLRACRAGDTSRDEIRRARSAAHRFWRLERRHEPRRP